MLRDMETSSPASLRGFVRAGLWAPSRAVAPTTYSKGARALRRSSWISMRFTISMELPVASQATRVRSRFSGRTNMTAIFSSLTMPMVHRVSPS